MTSSSGNVLVSASSIADPLQRFLPCSVEHRCKPPLPCPTSSMREAVVVSSAQFEQLSQQNGPSREGTRLHLIRTIGAFQSLSSHQCSQLCFAGREQQFARNRFIYHQGDTATHISLVLSGTVKVIRGSADGQEVVLRLQRSGDILDPCYTMRSRQTSAIAVEDCKLLSWEIETIRSLANQSSGLHNNFVRVIVTQLLEMQERFCELATLSVAGRLAQTLIRMHGSRSSTPINLSREELAQMAGTTVFAVSRLVAQWSKQGLVEAKRRAILIRDKNALLQAAEQDEVAA